MKMEEYKLLVLINNLIEIKLVEHRLNSSNSDLTDAESVWDELGI